MRQIGTPYEGIIICRCGHGKIHHYGKYENCTCDVGQYKNQKLCSCASLDIRQIIFRGENLRNTVSNKGDVQK